MQASPQTASWPLYSLRADAPGLRGIEQWAARIDADIAAHPDLVAFGTTVGVEETSTLSKTAAVLSYGLFGEWEQEYVVVRFKSRLPPQEAEEAVRAIVQRYLPNGLIYAVLVTQAFGSQVVAPTIAAVAEGTVAVAKAATPALGLAAAVVVGLVLYKVLK